MSTARTARTQKMALCCDDSSSTIGTFSPALFVVMICESKAKKIVICLARASLFAPATLGASGYRYVLRWACSLMLNVKTPIPNHGWVPLFHVQHRALPYWPSVQSRHPITACDLAVAGAEDSGFGDGDYTTISIGCCSVLPQLLQLLFTVLYHLVDYSLNSLYCQTSLIWSSETVCIFIVEDICCIQKSLCTLRRCIKH